MMAEVLEAELGQFPVMSFTQEQTGSLTLFILTMYFGAGQGEGNYEAVKCSYTTY